MLRSTCCDSAYRGTQNFTAASHKSGTLSKRRPVQRELACTEAMTAGTQIGKQSVGYNKGWVHDAAQAVAALQGAAHLPELIVWDLDYTLWPFWCEMYTETDTPSLYPESSGVLEACRDCGVPMAVASRTPTPGVAQAFMAKLGITSLFVSTVLIPASSGFDHTSAQKDIAHFPRIRDDTGIAYDKMLFFDDEHKNVARVARLGVASVLVSSGVSAAVLAQGLRLFDQQARQQ